MILGKISHSVYEHVDPKTILEMVDFREYFWPMTWSKYGVLLLVAMAVAGIVVSEYLLHWIEKSMAITRAYMLPVLIIVICLEPLMITLILLLGRIPDLPIDYAEPAAEQVNVDVEKRETYASSPDMDKNVTALVIPCHNSDHEALEKVLKSAYPHFSPRDIFIVDNGRSKYPTGDLRSFVREQHPEINYIWSPIGSKNAAQLVGALAARNHQFIMTVDDDVSIPANFRAPLDKIDDRTKGVAFPLKAIDANGKCPLFMVAWQDCEYRMAGLTKLAESNVCGVLFPHGAGWFCERETLIELISNYHSIDFIAEDVNTGLSMQKMKKFIAFDPRVILETEVPTTIFGPGLNWWMQRKNSWEMGRHGRLLAFLGRLFLSFNGQRTLHGIITQKFLLLYSIASIIVDWVRVPVLVTMGGNIAYWRTALLLTLFSVFPLLAYKYISCRRRPDLQPPCWGCLTYPLYKQLYSLISIFGAIRCVMFYIGGHKRPKSIRQMIKEGDESVFWKDPRFATNPGYLADEGELQKANLDLRASENSVVGFPYEETELMFESPATTLATNTRVASLSTINILHC